ncbi:MAG: hypothetical protein LBS02_00885 [Hungatella sp.]|jgi:hypothetical protein|nr:hypothetical protein [Hungatella sp.]
MRRKIITVALAAALTVAMTMTSFAGVWRSDSNGWWWQNDNGSWPMNTWQWLDGDNNGTSECYYFDAHGYCLQGTRTPDGYDVNGDGAWTVNGVVQTRPNDVGKGDDNSGNEDTGNAEKIKALDLVKTDPVTTSRGKFNTFTGKHTVQGDVLTRGFAVYVGDYTSKQAEYYNGGKYSSFKTRLAISADSSYSSDSVIIVEILDEALDVLDSVEVKLRQAPEEFTVDISGTDYVTIRVTIIEGSYGTLLMENPVFK